MPEAEVSSWTLTPAAVTLPSSYPPPFSLIEWDLLASTVQAMASRANVVWSSTWSPILDTTPSKFPNQR